MKGKPIMLKRTAFLTGMFIFFFLMGPVQATPVETYKIGAGDVLIISVWKNPDLTRELVVLPDGAISFPLVGDVPVEGLSVGELKGNLISQLEKYISDPVLSISVKQVNSMMIYVIGKVNGPGRFLLNDDINVLQALALARGLNAFAREKEIKVFRKSPEGTIIHEFNYKEVAKGENMDQNIVLERGDVIVVP